MVKQSSSAVGSYASPASAAPGVLIVGAGGVACNTVAERLSVPCIQVPVTELTGTLDSHAGLACVVLPVSLAEPELLREIDWRIAAWQPMRILIAVEAQELDLVGASLGYAWVDYTSGPALTADVAQAIALTAGDRSRLLASDEAVSLQELGEEASRIAHALSKLAAKLPLATSHSAAGELDAVRIRRILRLRRLRERLFPPEMFADPAWDILLDLTAARLEGVAVSVSSLCIAASVPMTTGLRWIKGMAEAGLLVREPDPNDARRVFISLSEDGFRRMRDCLLALQAEGGLV